MLPKPTRDARNSDSASKKSGALPRTYAAKMRGSIRGESYLRQLLDRFPDVEGRTDFCAFWFRRAHERLRAGGRAGLVGTSGIRVGKAREAALDYLVANGGTITNAVSSREWPGEAVVNVSMVNWVRGDAEGPHNLVIGDVVFKVARIPTHLQLQPDVGSAKEINEVRVTAEGVSFGHAAFRSTGDEGFALESLSDPRAKFLRPVATGDDLLRGRLDVSPEYCIWLTEADTEALAETVGGAAFTHLKTHVYVTIKQRAESGKETDHYKTWLSTWWKPHWSRESFFRSLRVPRMLVCSKVIARPIFAFISSVFIPNNTMQMFALDDDYSFGVLQSNLHWEWTKAKGGKVSERIRYTTDVWRTFPWPQDLTELQVAAVAQAARELRRVRAALISDNGWSLRQLHQAAEVDGPHPLKDAQAALDTAVTDAYGIPPDQPPAAFLLELNLLVAEDKEQGRDVRGPGLPEHLDPNDSRWMSTDCIKPPPVEN